MTTRKKKANENIQKKCRQQNEEARPKWQNITTAMANTAAGKSRKSGRKKKTERVLESGRERERDSIYI